MEPATIYAASDQLKYQVKWDRVTTDSEWIYIGHGEEVNTTKVMQAIFALFKEPEIIVAIDRQQSFITSVDQLPEALQGILGFRNFIVWNTTFKQALEFSDIGVMRYGRM